MSSNVLEVGSATIGPWVLLNVASPVAAPCPGIGLPTRCQVAPSSVERWTRINELLPESWYETQTLEPLDVIHCRSTPAVSSTLVEQPLGPVALAGQFVTETPSVKALNVGLTTKSRSARCVVPVEATS